MRQALRSAADDGSDVKPRIRQIMGAVAGIGGLALGVLLYVFRDIIRKLVLKNLKRDHAFQILNRIVVLVAIVTIVGIIAWVVSLWAPGPTRSAKEPGHEQEREAPTNDDIAALQQRVRDAFGASIRVKSIVDEDVTWISVDDYPVAGQAEIERFILVKMKERKISGVKFVAPKRKHVVIMDGKLPDIVYDPRTREEGGSNADDIDSALKDIDGIRIDTESTSLQWSREDDVIAEKPDLIIMHASCFYSQTRASNDNRKLLSCMRVMGQEIRRLQLNTQFIIYSRGIQAEADIRGMTRYYEGALGLRGRVVLFCFEKLGLATFRDVNTRRRLKSLVRRLLKV
jgi:hypothetical protein